MRIYLLVICMITGISAGAAEFSFESIEGGDLSLSDFKGNPVLIVNTASRCGFTSQYDGLQTVYDKYRTKGLTVLAIPSNDFKQELAEDEKVKQFCKINFNLNLPMTTITHVKGPNAHPFFKWIKNEYGFVPSWNFNKILLNQDGQMVASFGSVARPTGWRITKSIEALLD
jgi:glutathione peroxidase